MKNEKVQFCLETPSNPPTMKQKPETSGKESKTEKGGLENIKLAATIYTPFVLSATFSP